MNFENSYIMKKALFLIMLLALMGNAMAQAPVAAETMNIMLSLPISLPNIPLSPYNSLFTIHYSLFIIHS